MNLVVENKYIQNKDANPHNPHWRGIPKGSKFTEANCKCWLCKCGCAVLSYLFWKQLEPNKENVENCLDEKADFDWHHNGLYNVSKRENDKIKIVAPCIAKLIRPPEKNTDHFIFISEFVKKDEIINYSNGSVTIRTTKRFNYFDPNNNKRKYNTIEELENDVQECHY